MNVLITGATGYVGKHLVKEPSQQDNDLFALVRESSINKAIELLDFKPRYNNSTEGLIDCYFRQSDNNASL